MRNLKKFLALVLAMVMAFSLMLSASAANFDDKHFSDTEEVTQAFKEAVAVLTGLNVIKGDGSGDIKDIRPQSDITRAEAAALVYRIATGDVDDKQVGLYADYSDFVDVKPRTANDAGDWFAGYVGYCQNAGIIKGTSRTTFNPYGKVTGYEVLAMILRAVGYGKDNEFTGPNWQVNVASLAKTKHISDSVSSAAYDYTLNQAARREIVAELLFRGSLLNQVKWTPGLGYVEFENGIQDRTNSLAWDVFRLHQHDWQAGTWGDPYYTWNVFEKDFSDDTEIARIEAEPNYTFHDTMIECDLAEALDISTEETFTLFVNSNSRITNQYRLVANDTATKVGGQGRLVKVYMDLATIDVRDDVDDGFYTPLTAGNVITMKDTFLAKVTNVTPAVLDRNEHVITPARLYVDLYDKPQDSATSITPNPSKRVLEKASTSKDNWEFAIGDMVTFNAYTDNRAGIVEGLYGTSVNGNGNASNAVVDYPINHTFNVTNANRAAFESERVAVWNTDRNDYGTISNTLTQTVRLHEDVKKAEFITGAQTVTQWNTGKHTVEGTDYPDQLDLWLDVAGTTTNTQFAWYMDDYKNIIGIGELPTAAQYGVITSIYSAFNQGETSTDGTTKAIANVLMSDGSTPTITIDRFLVAADGNVDTTAHRFSSGTGITVDATNNTRELIPVYDFNLGGGPMQSDDRNALGTTSLARVSARQGIYISPVAGINQTEEAKATTRYHMDDDYYGILRGNMYKFVESANGTKTAIEVAGKGDGAGIYSRHWYAFSTTDTNAASPTTSDIADRTLNKTQATLPMTWTSSGTSSNDLIRLDNNTKIFVRTTGTDLVKVYNGVSDLPGNIIVDPSTEMDWADPNLDGRADYLYITGRTAGNITYGLFYTRNGAAQWNGTTGTIAGYLNGESTTLTFNNEAEYLAVVNNRTAYAGNIFAVRMIDGNVVNLMGTPINDTVTANKERIANTGATSVTLSSAVSLNSVVNGNTGVTTTMAAGTNNVNLFQTGTTNGNEYNSTTAVVYLRDENSNATSNVTYNMNGDSGTSIYGDTITVDGTGSYASGTIMSGVLANGFLLTGTTKRLGDDMNYLNDPARRSNVTIVYDTATGYVYEIYVATDPDVTPGVGTNYVAPNAALAAGSYALRVDGLTAWTADGTNVSYTGVNARVNAVNSAFANPLSYTGSHALSFTNTVVGQTVGIAVYSSLAAARAGNDPTAASPASVTANLTAGQIVVVTIVAGGTPYYMAWQVTD